MAKPRLIAGLLNRHPEIDRIHHDLGMALRLKIAPHHAERHHRLAIFGHECRDDRVERTFVRFQAIAMFWIKRKCFAAILHHETDAVRTDRGTESAEVALDQRDHVALAIGGRQIRRIGIKLGVAILYISIGFLLVNQLCTLLAIFFRDQPFDRHIGEFGVGVVDRAVLESQFFCLGQQMQMFDRIGLQFADIKVLQNIQHLQRGDSLAVRWNFPNVIAAIVGADRFDPVRRVIGQVFHRHVAVQLFRFGDDCFGDIAFVKRGRTIFADCFIGFA